MSDIHDVQSVSVSVLPSSFFPCYASVKDSIDDNKPVVNLMTSILYSLQSLDSDAIERTGTVNVDVCRFDGESRASEPLS